MSKILNRNYRVATTTKLLPRTRRTVLLRQPSIQFENSSTVTPSNPMMEQRRTYLWRSHYFPFASRIDGEEYLMPPTSHRALFTNLFDQTDDPNLWKLDDKLAETHKTLNPTDNHAHFPMPVVDPHRFEWANIAPELHYYQFFEDTFPRQPNLEKGEFATGALVTRTSVWHTPGEPAIKSISRFEPQNFRAAGYAENRPIVECSPPNEFPQCDESRIGPGHPSRKPALYLCHGATVAAAACAVRSALYWIIYSVMTTEPGMRWPKPIEVKYKQVQPGEQITVSAAGAVAFIRHRTDAEIRVARADDEDVNALKDPELDAERCPDPEWLFCSASCTHLGCIPFKGGDYFGGFLCPCHGSHYDASGRIRKGPAPRNLPIIRSEVIDEDTILLGESAPTERRWI